MKKPPWSLDLSSCDLGCVWKDWSMFPLFLLGLMNSIRESLPLWIMFLETCYSVFGKSLITNLTCAMSQMVHILNTYEIGSRINLWCSTPKLFNFIELDFVVFKVIAFKIITLNIWSINLIFITIITSFWLTCPSAFFRCLMSNSGVHTESWIEPFIQSTVG